MADSSKIEWTDASWNVVSGCVKVSSGCDHCYAETFAERWRGTPGHHFEQGFDVVVHRDRLTLPLKWRKPKKIFVNSMSDVFLDTVSVDLIGEMFAVMSLAPHHTFQVLTKRHGRMRSLLNDEAFQGYVAGAAVRLASDYGPGDPAIGNPVNLGGWPIPNVHLGVSVESQKWADIRIPALLDTPAAVRWISAEPLLGPVDLSRWTSPWNRAVVHSRAYPEHTLGPYDDAYGTSQIDCDSCDFTTERGGLDWVVDGGESGPGARPAHPRWFRTLRDQCRAARIAYFHKQHGAYTWQIEGPYREPDRYVNAETGEALPGSEVPDTGTWKGVWKVGKKVAGRELDGTTWDEFPQSAEVAR